MKNKYYKILCYREGSRISHYSEILLASEKKLKERVRELCDVGFDVKVKEEK